MKNFFKSLFADKKRLLILVVILFVGYFVYKHYAAPAGQTRYVLAKASKQTIVASVSGTGQVSQDHSVNLTAPSGGKITAISAKQGQQLKAGQVIAIVDETNNSISLNQARAQLASAQASYDQVMAGATPQDIQISQLTVQSDQQSVDNAQANLESVKKQQDLAVANALNNLLNSTPQAIPALNNLGVATVSISGNYTGTTTGSYFLKYSASDQQFVISGLENGQAWARSTPPIALGTLGLYVNITGKAIEGDIWTVNLPNTQASNYISNNNAYQNALNNQITAIASAQNQLASAKNKLQQDQINLQVKQQPPTEQQVESARASLLNAQAALQNAQIAYDNNIIKAPFDGVLAQLNSQLGDQVTGSTVIGTVITNQSVVIIPLNEIDVSKVQVGNKATMTFDAVDGLTISGKVVQIDNIGTVTQGVVNYNIKIAFDTEDPRIKPGMSVNVSIITASKADVLAVPNSAIKTQGGQSYVLVLDPAKTQSAPSALGVTSSAQPSQVTVQTGLADDSFTEIVGGNLKEADSVVTQTITPTAAKTTTTSATNALRIGGAGAGRAAGGAAAGR